MTRLPRLLFLAAALAALPASAQGFADSPATGGSRIFSEGLDPAGDPARFDRAPSGVYVGGLFGDLKPRGEADALSGVLAAAPDPARLDAALETLQAHPWALRIRSYGLSWARTGGIRFGYTREDLRGSLAEPGPSGLPEALDARQAVIDRLYLGAGSQAGHSALGFTVRLERVRFGAGAYGLPGGSVQPALADPQAPLQGRNLADSVTSATLDAGYVQELGSHARFGLTLDRIASRRFGDLKEDPQGRAGLQVDLGPALSLAVESDLNAAARLPLPVKQRTDSASLRITLGPGTRLMLGAERRRVEGAPASTVFGAAVQVQSAPLVLAFGFRYGDDHPLAALALRLPGAP